MRVKYSAVFAMERRNEPVTIAWDQMPPTAPERCPICGVDSLKRYIDPEIGPYVQCESPGCDYVLTDASMTEEGAD